LRTSFFSIVSDAQALAFESCTWACHQLLGQSGITLDAPHSKVRLQSERQELQDCDVADNFSLTESRRIWYKEGWIDGFLSQ
jgi:hypothetical protein